MREQKTEKSRSRPGPGTGARAKGRPSLDEAAAIDRAIKEAALRELLEKGEAATLNAVAMAAGLSRKSVYARYSSKTELFMEAVREVLAHVEPLRFDRSGTLEERIANYICAVFELLEKPHAKAFQKALAMEPGPTADLRNDLIDATRTIFYTPLLSVLEDAQAKDEVAAPGDSAELARLIMTMALVAARVPEDLEARTWPLQNRSPEYARFVGRILVGGLGRRG